MLLHMIDDDFNRQNEGSPCSMIQPLAKNSELGNGSKSELRCFKAGLTKPKGGLKATLNNS